MYVLGGHTDKDLNSWTVVPYHSQANSSFYWYDGSRRVRQLDGLLVFAALCVLRRFLLVVCCRCCAAILLSARTSFTSTTASGEPGRKKGEGVNTHKRAWLQFHDTNVPAAVVAQGLSCFLHVGAVSQACCCYCWCLSAALQAQEEA